MKSVLRKIVLLLIKMMARHRMKKFRGKVIAVTGTVGKTSTKEAIFTVLNSKFKVLKNKGNMNSDFGLPLTILEIESGQSSLVKWSWLLIKGFLNCFSRNHNEIMLLEFGVDKPKDMNFLLSLVRPDIAVITNISPVHMAEGQFKDIEEVFAEKRKIVDELKEHGLAIINIDNPYLEKLAKERKRKSTITFGRENEKANFLVNEVRQSLEGLDFVVHNEEEKTFFHANVLGEYQIYVLLPAIICGLQQGMTTEEIAEALKRYSLPPGRMSVIKGLNESMILDSSYNSSPDALEKALELLRIVGKSKRKIAVLGSMNELGEKSAALHEMVGEIIPSCTDMLITVGGDAKLFAKKALELGMKEENVMSFKNALEAAEYMKDKVSEDDVILVKGSQNNVRLEKFVKALMAFPEDAKTLLVRQGKEWEAKL